MGRREHHLDLALYGDIDEREAAFEKFVWAADGNAITEMMDRQGSIEEFEIVEGGFKSELKTLDSHQMFCKWLSAPRLSVARLELVKRML